MSADSLRLTIAASAFVIGNLYLLVLWVYAVIRTRLAFFGILAFSGLVYLLLAIVNAALIYAPAQTRSAIGPQFATFYAVFVLVQPFNLLLAIIGHTILVRWVVRAKRKAKAAW